MSIEMNKMYNKPIDKELNKKLKELGINKKVFEWIIDKGGINSGNKLYDMLLDFEGQEEEKYLFKELCLIMLFYGGTFSKTRSEITDLIFELDLKRIMLDFSNVKSIFIKDLVIFYIDKGYFGEEKKFISYYIGDELFDYSEKERNEIYSRRKSINKRFKEIEKAGFELKGEEYNELLEDEDFDVNVVSNRGFRFDLRKEFGNVIMYVDNDKLNSLEHLGVEGIKKGIKEKGIEGKHFKFIVDVLIGEINDEELLETKKYDILYEKFGFKFTSLSYKKRDFLLSHEIEELKKLRKNKDINQYCFDNMKKEVKVKEEIDYFYEGVNFDFVGILTKESLKSLTQKNRKILYEDIGKKKAKELSKLYKEEYGKICGIGIARFIIQQYLRKNYDKYLDFQIEFGRDFTRLHKDYKEDLYEIGINKIRTRLGKDDLSTFVKKYRGRRFYSDEYNEFKEEFGHSFSTQSKENKDFLLEEGLNKVKKFFKKNNKIENRFKLRAYIYGRDNIKNSKYVCNRCGKVHLIKEKQVQFLRRGFELCNCDSFRSKPEREIYNSIVKYYDGKILVNKNVLKVNNRMREIDIYLPEINFGVEYNGYYYHGGDDNSEDKIEASKEQGIDLFVILESEYVGNKNRFFEEIKSKILEKL